MRNYGRSLHSAYALLDLYCIKITVLFAHDSYKASQMLNFRYRVEYRKRTPFYNLKFQTDSFAATA